ncbi:MAG: tRNA (adenosine(37)-N6)-threonylcarbamoyltransferase complex dimerization subunit type 1 TsaB [Betaproteobacteria bacterium]|nr:tRNA (adenosine(37)-N6)-threonylcarbamoyltransferase complex dimerization subunit type 1 TsaB [Betaproteobacteria bacterium]
MKDDSAAYSGSLLAISSSATPAAMGRFDAHGQSLWIYAEVVLKTGEGLLAALGQHFKGRPEALELIVLDRGPGQFTGLRAGIGLAQGLSMGWGIPILAIDSASVMAWSAWERLTASTSSEGSQMLSPALPRDRTQTRFVSIRDARLGAYYVAVFESLESLASSDCDSVRALSLAQVLALLRQLSAGEQGDALVLIASDAASHERLAMCEAEADGQHTPRLKKRSLHWIVPEPSSLLGALARLGLKRIENGVVPSSADAIQALYVRDEVAMDLSAQRAYRRSRSLATEA